MATDKLEKKVIDEFSGKLLKNATNTDKASFQPPAGQISTIYSIATILDERRNQRRVVFKFAIYSSCSMLIFLVLIVAGQSWYRFFYNPNFSFFSGYELQVFSVGVFSQVIGLIYIIAKRLWDDSTYIK